MLGHFVLSNNVQHNEKSTIFVTTVNGFRVVGSLQAIIKITYCFPYSVEFLAQSCNYRKQDFSFVSDKLCYHFSP